MIGCLFSCLFIWIRSRNQRIFLSAGAGIAITAGIKIIAAVAAAQRIGVSRKKQDYKHVDQAVVAVKAVVPEKQNKNKQSDTDSAQ